MYRYLQRWDFLPGSGSTRSAQWPPSWTSWAPAFRPARAKLPRSPACCGPSRRAARSQLTATMRTDGRAPAPGDEHFTLASITNYEYILSVYSRRLIRNKYTSTCNFPAEQNVQIRQRAIELNVDTQFTPTVHVSSNTSERWPSGTQSGCNNLRYHVRWTDGSHRMEQRGGSREVTACWWAMMMHDIEIWTHHHHE